MRILLALLVFIGMLFFTKNVLAAPAVISKNVTVVQGATPAQCPASWRGDADPATDITLSRFGSNDTEGPGINSCTGCAINKVGDCVCSTCYSFYDSN